VWIQTGEVRAARIDPTTNRLTARVPGVASLVVTDEQLWAASTASESRGRALLHDVGVVRLVEPRLDQILEFCGEDPVERVFLEDLARRGLGRFAAIAANGRLRALCHAGVNVVPSGERCGEFAHLLARSGARMIIGEERAVGDLWDAARKGLPSPHEDRAGQPVYTLDVAPEPGATGLREARSRDLRLLLPACAAAHREELGIDPLRRDSETFRRRTEAQIEERRSWLWEEDGTILFKAEASAWTPHAVQLQQVWVDPVARGRGYAKRGMRDLCRRLLQKVPVVCLFVRPENAPAIRVYEAVGMRRAGFYRSILL
jgi:uncharacterized protein